MQENPLFGPHAARCSSAYARALADDPAAAGRLTALHLGTERWRLF